MADILQTLTSLSVLVFVVSSTLAMGLSLTIAQIIDPLKNVGLVVKALIANFVIVPLIAFLIVNLMDLSEAQSIGLILLATAAGAPFLPKLVQAAKGNMAFRQLQENISLKTNCLPGVAHGLSHIFQGISFLERPLVWA